MRGQRNQKLLDLLAKRGLTVAKVARMVFVSRCSVVQILRGQRKGSVTWKKLQQVLDAKELECAIDFANQGLKTISDHSSAYGYELVLETEPSIKVVCRALPPPPSEVFHVEQEVALT